MTDINGVEIKVGMKAVVLCNWSMFPGETGVVCEVGETHARLQDVPGPNWGWSTWLSSKEVEVQQ